jgi:hypothetical protein
LHGRWRSHWTTNGVVLLLLLHLGCCTGVDRLSDVGAR